MNKKLIITITLILLSSLSIYLAFLVIKDTTLNTSLPKKEAKCGIENCHGLDIVCGSSPAEMCTAMYQVGDRCRQFAKCEIIDSSCQLIQNDDFNNCKICVEECINKYADDPNELFLCESSCGEK
jgi:hypothetical protein